MIWDYLGQFYGDYAEVGVRQGYTRKYGLIDRAGTVVIPIIYDGIYYEDSTDFVRVNLGEKHSSKYFNSGKWGVVDLNNQIIIPLKYNVLGRFVGGVAPAKYRGRWGMIDLSGNITIPFRYASLSLPHVARNAIEACSIGTKKWGVMGCAGNEIIPFMYDDLHMPMNTDCEWLPVQLNSERFYIDWHNRRVLF